MSSKPASRSKFIPREEVGAVSPWRFGAVGSGDDDLPVHGVATSEEDWRIAHEEGYAEGYDVGRLLGQREGQHKLDEYIRTQGRGIAQRLALLLESAERNLHDSQQQVAQGVIEIAAELARQVVRHELSINPNALLPVVREALATLREDSKNATVRLHPKDLEVLEEPLRQEFGNAGVSWVGDASLRPGNCLVEAAGTTVDGTLASRWSRAVAGLGIELPWDDGDEDVGDGTA
ncbi:MAG: flagellar assembly protein FliH [Burkholderiaceae bacterium]|nr:flagellar assembly protein FliH [Burkholderiaceae bacterium]